jgi:hypothetical protein
VSFATITVCVASQQVFIVVVYFVIDSVWELSDTPSYYLIMLYQLQSLFNIKCCENMVIYGEMEKDGQERGHAQFSSYIPAFLWTE